MNKLQKIVKSFGDISFFFGVFVGSVTFSSAVIALLDILKVDLQYFKDIKWVSVYLIFIHCILLSFIALYYRKLLGLGEEANLKEYLLEENDSILVSDLIASLKTALNSKKYLEVIRFGSALSKPFFASGNYRARLSVGILVEEAAAWINDEKTQMIELIDSIGWMYAELGDLENGENNIRHGLNYAEKLDDKFYISKAYRHIGALFRRKEDYKTAETNYSLSIEIAESIKDEGKRLLAIAGTNYAQSLLYYHTRDFKKALHFINLSIKKFDTIKNAEKVNMALTTKAQIYFSLDRIQESKDLFRTSLNEAERRTLRLEITRCCIGLTKIYIKEKDWKKAKEYLDKSDKVEKDIQTASEVAEIDILRTKLPKNV